MKKRELENYVFLTAVPILKEIYGEFIKDEDQKDRPDAAIFVNDNKDRIGIEITTATSFEELQYFNDKKYGNEKDAEIRNEVIQTGERSDLRALKKYSNKKPYDFIVNGIKAKKDKYKSYKSQGFKEVALLVYEDFADRAISEYHKNWTNFLLSRKNFPFNKVIYVGKNSCILYDRNKHKKTMPIRNYSQELGSTKFKSGMLPVGKEVNIRQMWTDEPIIKPKK